MHLDHLPEFQDIVRGFTVYLQNQHDLGMETVPLSDAAEMDKILGSMGEGLSREKETPELSTITVEEVRQELGDCTRCSLCTARKHIVFGQGNCEASLVFVGEAPGREEDLAGEPFVGEAGQLLTRIIHAINLKREDVYITNVIKCRPPKNRDPQLEEIEACLPFLKKQLQAIYPRVICALGRFAAQSLLETTEKISTLRGTIGKFQNIRVVPTFHPASLLRNPHWKRDVWRDMQLIQKLLEENH